MVTRSNGFDLSRVWPSPVAARRTGGGALLAAPAAFLRIATEARQFFIPFLPVSFATTGRAAWAMNCADLPVGLTPRASARGVLFGDAA